MSESTLSGARPIDLDRWCVGTSLLVPMKVSQHAVPRLGQHERNLVAAACTVVLHQVHGIRRDAR